MIDKSGYNNIDVPEKLSNVVQIAIDEGLSRKTIWKRSGVLRIVASMAAAFVFCVAFLLNISPSFAAAAYELPLVGELCRIITFREYHFEDDIKYIDVRLPEIKITENTDLERRINLEIQKYMNELLEADTVRAKEYYDAYIETGGIPEEYIPLGITLDYEIKCSNYQYASFVISHYETKFNAYNKQYYYNIDLETGRIITLRDLLGADYKQIIADSIEREITTWDEEQRAILWEDLEFADLISECTDFYLTEDGNVVVVFSKYEIAVGAAGTVEFIILLEE